MSIQRMSLNLGMIGEDRPVTVKYSYHPGERDTRESPGCPEEWDIESVTDDHTGIDITAMLELDEVVEALKQWID